MPDGNEVRITTEQVYEVLNTCYDPCCKERSVSVVEMGLIQNVQVAENGHDVAANFPDINFVIFHVGLPFIDEICWQLVRYPNLYASIAATLNFIVRAPRAFAENMGKLMFWCGEDKILYGGETPIWHPGWALDAFWNFELPEDLVTGYGYPQLTKQAKKKILGGNLARLMGLDVEQKVAELKA